VKLLRSIPIQALPLALALGLAFAGPPVSAAAAPDPAAVSAARAQLQQGVNQNKVETILGARGRFEALAAAEPKVALLPYWIAVADWRVTGMLQRSNPRLARATCDHGLAALERALALEPRLAEAIALKGGLLGLSLGLPGAPDMMSVGMQMEGLYERAVTLDSLSPTVRFLEGLNTLHKPAFVGGGADKALPRLQRAIAAYDRHVVRDPLTPDWGHDDACLWAGRAALQAGDPAAAGAFYDQALKANPDNGWVRSSLIPEADSLLAARKASR
jgi:tetratricopeptide (TPR) repeat protein